ncbi:YHYH protein [Leucothrix arctica]|uniref:YHYH domain-containing protein n=1 Tax=Leucothrix arctica TaxID=1481894 RepID=A0A317CMR1_9GAMM|nr:YHYH protein [Leucothrix arctica]PWQ98743.1 hypothetical protein DKT75_02740 [Leucothrix arctica]
MRFISSVRPTLLMGVVGISLMLTACVSESEPVVTSTDTTDSTETSDSDSTTDDSETTTTTTFFSSAMFGSALKSVTQASCTLENGSTTLCNVLVFSANGSGDTEGEGTVGPYCPDDITVARSDTGMGIYDGDTNPGFQSLIDAVQSMDADGYDVVNEDGTVNFNDATSMGDTSLNYCVSAALESDLEVTYLIPITPEVRSEVYEIGTIASVGVGLNGVPLKGNPPSVTITDPAVRGTGSGNIPALDLCGGHPDPSGYYHWHMIPQSTNTVLESDQYSYTQDYGMTCSNSTIAFDEPAIFSGLAKDGYPIYGAYDSVNDENVLPDTVATVDECNGHTHATAEFTSGAYHYHALENTAPNIPACLTGSFVENDVTVR